MAKKDLPILDINKLESEAIESAGRPFLRIKPPDGNEKFAYRLLFVGEPFEFRNKRYNRDEIHCDAELLGTINDDNPFGRYSDEATGPCRVNFSQHGIRERKLLEFKPLTDKVIDIMITEKRKGGRGSYYVYAVQEVKGEFSVFKFYELMNSAIPTEE